MLKRASAFFMVGVAALVLLIALLIPKYKQMTVQSREGVLRVNLTTMRDVIKQFTQDKKRAPQSLQDLVDAGYLAQLPIDPMTNSNSTWKPVVETITGQTQGITNVRSGADSTALNGTSYREW